MREVTRDEKFPDQPREGSTGPELHFEANQSDANAGSRQPTETELVIVSLLMRLYDLNLAILSHLDEKRADEIYEAHEKGAHFNPPIFVPEVGNE